MEELTLIQRVAIWILPVLFAITLHEVAHGWVANILGDNTAKQLGRLSLNPIKHVDPIGTVLVPGLLLLLGGFIFGWAKPVPVDWRKLRRPHRDMAIVAIAGPTANLLMAITWTLLAKLAVALDSDFISRPLVYMSGAGIVINIVLMMLNLLPIPPLDGGRVLTGLLPVHLGEKFGRLEPYGFFILLALIATGLLSNILGYPVSLMQRMLFGAAGL
jgi:Zn-dependent protease